MLKRAIAGAVWATALVLVAPAQAADPQRDIGERELERELREQQRRRLERPEPTIDIEPGAAPEDEDEGPCFQVAQINIQGNTLLSDEQLNAIKAPYQNTCMNRGAVNTLIYRLTVAYMDRGYITARVYVPQQDLGAGALTLVVIEGFIEDIRLNENERSDRWKLFWAMPAEKGEPLQLRDLEQGLDQINRVPSANATLRLLPGDRPGGTVVQIDNAPEDEFRGHAAFDNNGPGSTGEDRLRLGVEADNVLDINDAWTLFYIGSLDTNALAFNLGLPFRRWSFSLSRSYSEYLSRLTEDTDLFGQSDTAGLGADYLLYRDGNSQWRLKADLTYRKSKRYVVDVALQPQRQAPARLGAAYTHRRQDRFWNVELDYAEGTTLFDADDDPAGAPPGAPVSQFSKVELNVYHSRGLTRRLHYRGSLRAQYSADVLISSEQIHIGDQATVRGYRDTPLSGDRGVYWRNEVSAYNLLSGDWGGNWLRRMSPLMFIDYGRLKDNAGGGSRDMLGAGLGVRYSGRFFNLDISWGRGVSADPGELEGHTEFYLSLDAKVF